jgi:zinc transport system substrate-binding protein
VISRIVLATAVAISSAVAAGCGGTSSDKEAEQVVAAFYPLAFAAEQIAGDEVRVVSLTPPGSEPHDLELSPSQVREVQQADLVLYLGRGFMPSLERALDGRNGRSLDLLTAADPEAGTSADPHVWLDPVRYAQIARAIASELGHEQQGNAFATRLEELDAELREGLGSCARHEIVTSHAAFGYFVARYGLRQLPLTGLEPEAEPTPRDLERLVRDVERSGATTVFAETLVSPKLAETIARESGAKTAVLNPIEGLTDEQAAAGADYFSLMRDNLATLREALGCR